MPDPQRDPAAALVAAVCVAARMLDERWAMLAVDGTLRELFAAYARLDAQLADSDFAALNELAYRALATRTDVGRELPYSAADACALLEPVLMRRVASSADAAADLALIVPCGALNKEHWERIAALAEYATSAAGVLAARDKRPVSAMRVRIVQVCAVSRAAPETRIAQIRTSYSRAIDVGADAARISLELWFVNELQFAPTDAVVYAPHRALSELDERERLRDRLRGDRRAEKTPQQLPVLRVDRDVVARWHAFAPGVVVRVERRALDEGGTAFHYVRCE